MNSFKINEQSYFCPAAAMHNGHYLAWTGTDGRLNVGIRYGTSAALTCKHTFNETCIGSPALVSFQGKLKIAWSDGIENKLHLATVADGGNTLADTVDFEDDSSGEGPNLAVHNDKLYIAWRGTDSPHHRVNVGQIDGGAIVKKIVTTESTIAAPSIASFQNKLYVAWTAPNYTIKVGAIHDSAIAEIIETTETSHEAPSLSCYQNNLRLAWIGIDPAHHLNIMTYKSGEFTNKQLLQGSFTTEMPMIHRGPPTLHFGRHGFKMQREGNSGIKLVNNFITYHSCMRLPEPPPKNAQDLATYSDYNANNHHIFILPLEEVHS